MSGRKRSLTIARHRTSISLEDEFWDGLQAIATAEGRSVADLVAEIDQARDRDASLSAAIRLYVLKGAKAGSA